tara:strand:- start:6484 stop:6900 length:417 start_codon:yes stop_codon:yes gene_type:complete
MTIEIIYSGTTEETVDVKVYQQTKELVNQKNRLKEKGEADIEKVFICRELDDRGLVYWFIFQAMAGKEVVTGVFSDTEAKEDLVLIQHLVYGDNDAAEVYEPGFLKAKGGKLIFNKGVLVKGSFITVGKLLTTYTGIN